MKKCLSCRSKHNNRKHFISFWKDHQKWQPLMILLNALCVYINYKGAWIISRHANRLLWPNDQGNTRSIRIASSVKYIEHGHTHDTVPLGKYMCLLRYYINNITKLPYLDVLTVNTLYTFITLNSKTLSNSWAIAWVHAYSSVGFQCGSRDLTHVVCMINGWYYFAFKDCTDSLYL